jgi:hypothetical protein
MNSHAIIKQTSCEKIVFFILEILKQIQHFLYIDQTVNMVEDKIALKVKDTIYHNSKCISPDKWNKLDCFYMVFSYKAKK